MRTLLLVSVLAACGRETPDPQAAEARQKTAPPEASPQASSRPDVTALRVDKLPDCDVPGRVVYLATTGKFNYCEADGGWSELVVKGDKGDVGAAGADGKEGDRGPQGLAGAAGATGSNGATGAQGPQGQTGATGTAGADGTDGQTVGGSMWYDPVTTKYWTFDKTLATTYAEAQATCTGGWALPTAAQWRTALLHGFVNVINSGFYAWLSDGTNLSVDGVTTAGNNAAPYCVQQ